MVYVTGMATWNIYKRKNICGMYKSEGKAVAFHLKKPCIGLVWGLLTVIRFQLTIEENIIIAVVVPCKK